MTDISVPPPTPQQLLDTFSERITALEAENKALKEVDEARRASIVRQDDEHRYFVRKLQERLEERAQKLVGLRAENAKLREVLPALIRALEMNLNVRKNNGDFIHRSDLRTYDALLSQAREALASTGAERMMVGPYPKKAGVDTVALEDVDEASE